MTNWTSGSTPSTSFTKESFTTVTIPLGTAMGVLGLTYAEATSHTTKQQDTDFTKSSANSTDFTKGSSNSTEWTPSSVNSTGWS